MTLSSVSTAPKITLKATAKSALQLNVSVVIPAYNCQQYITTAIDSALATTAAEVIVIDDGSTDDTAGTVKAISDSRLRYHYQNNQGVSAARNQGIQLARADLVAFLDADDYFLPHKLSKQMAMFLAEPSLGLVQTGWKRVNEQGDAIADITPWTSAADLSLENWLRFKPVLPSALMIRKSWLQKVGGFDPTLQAAEDVDLVCRLALYGCKSAWCKEVAVAYRQRSHSAMGNSLIQARDLSKFLDKFFGQPNLPKSIQLLEQPTRYHTLLWAAWYLQHTGHLGPMAHYLQQAYKHTPHQSVETLIHWADSFEKFSADWVKPLDMFALSQTPEWHQAVSELVKPVATDR